MDITVEELTRQQQDARQKGAMLFAAAAASETLTGGMTLLRLVPASFETTLRFVKTARGDTPTSIVTAPDRATDKMITYWREQRQLAVTDRLKFIFQDIAALARISAEAERATMLRLSFYEVTNRLQPFMPHDGLRLIYDTQPNEPRWAITPLSGEKEIKLGASALYIDIVALEVAPERPVHSEERRAAFLSHLEAYKNKLETGKDLGAGGFDNVYYARLIDTNPYLLKLEPPAVDDGSIAPSSGVSPNIKFQHENKHFIEMDEEDEERNHAAALGAGAALHAARQEHAAGLQHAGPEIAALEVFGAAREEVNRGIEGEVRFQQNEIQESAHLAEDERLEVAQMREDETIEAAAMAAGEGEGALQELHAEHRTGELAFHEQHRVGELAELQNFETVEDLAHRARESQDELGRQTREDYDERTRRVYENQQELARKLAEEQEKLGEESRKFQAETGKIALETQTRSNERLERANEELARISDEREQERQAENRAERAEGERKLIDDQNDIQREIRENAEESERRTEMLRQDGERIEREERAREPEESHDNHDNNEPEQRNDQPENEEDRRENPEERREPESRNSETQEERHEPETREARQGEDRPEPREERHTREERRLEADNGDQDNNNSHQVYEQMLHQAGEHLHHPLYIDHGRALRDAAAVNYQTAAGAIAPAHTAAGWHASAANAAHASAAQRAAGLAASPAAYAPLQAAAHGAAAHAATAGPVKAAGLAPATPGPHAAEALHAFRLAGNINTHWPGEWAPMGKASAFSNFHGMPGASYAALHNGISPAQWPGATPPKVDIVDKITRTIIANHYASPRKDIAVKAPNYGHSFAAMFTHMPMPAPSPGPSEEG